MTPFHSTVHWLLWSSQLLINCRGASWGLNLPSVAITVTTTATAFRTPPSWTRLRNDDVLGARNRPLALDAERRSVSNDGYGGLVSSVVDDDEMSRRRLIVNAMAGLGAEAAWRAAVRTASALPTPEAWSLPPGTVETIESGRAAVIPNWLTPAETAALRADARESFAGGHFTNFVLSRNPNKADRAANDRWIMPSFPPGRRGSDNNNNNNNNVPGPFVDERVGDVAVRTELRARMATVRAVLGTRLRDRQTLADDVQTHETEYLRYGVGARLARHTDEHHIELKRPHGSRLPLKPRASRRSITWMIYLNDDWDAVEDGGCLRLHERARPAAHRVGARGGDLQVAWLRGTGNDDDDEPVFLDPFREGGASEDETCSLYTLDETTGRRRDLTNRPFPNAALYLAGGDLVASRLMADVPDDRRRLHLIDAPKSLVSSALPTSTRTSEKGEDGGERVRDVTPTAGTLVLFDSVSLPHEVLATNRERFGVQGWFHELL